MHIRMIVITKGELCVFLIFSYLEQKSINEKSFASFIAVAVF